MAAHYSKEQMTAIYARVLDSLYTDDEKPDSNRRQAWTANHANIMGCITKTLNEKGYMPTVVQIAEETHLSRVTVTKHLKHFERDEYLSLHRQI